MSVSFSCFAPDRRAQLRGEIIAELRCTTFFRSLDDDDLTSVPLRIESRFRLGWIDSLRKRSFLFQASAHDGVRRLGTGLGEGQGVDLVHPSASRLALGEASSCTSADAAGGVEVMGLVAEWRPAVVPSGTGCFQEVNCPAFAWLRYSCSTWGRPRRECRGSSDSCRPSP
jgi:hypothetical protein